MPKPKKSKSKKNALASLVSAYESGAESESGASNDSADNTDTGTDTENSNSNSNNSSDNDDSSNTDNEISSSRRSSSAASSAKPGSHRAENENRDEDNDETTNNDDQLELSSNNTIGTESPKSPANSPQSRRFNDNNAEVEENSKESHTDTLVDGDEIETDEKKAKSLYTIEKGFPPGCDLIELPPAVKTECSISLQNKIIAVAERMKPPFNYSINEDIHKKKLYKNPSIYQKFIEANNTDEFGSSFPNYIPDLKSHGFSDYLELDEVQRVEWARKDKEKKERTKIEMVVGTKKKL